jgi:hypothetical protein
MRTGGGFAFNIAAMIVERYLASTRKLQDM